MRKARSKSGMWSCGGGGGRVGLKEEEGNAMFGSKA